MGRLTTLATICGLLLALLCSLPASAQQGGTYRINDEASGGVLNLRDGPGVGHPTVVAIPAGTNGVLVSECAMPDDSTSRLPFCRAAWSGYEGWISSCCITRTGDTPGLAVTETGTAEPGPVTRLSYDGVWSVMIKPRAGLEFVCQPGFVACTMSKPLAPSSLGSMMIVESRTNGSLAVGDVDDGPACRPRAWGHAPSTDGDGTASCRYNSTGDGLQVFFQDKSAGGFWDVLQLVLTLATQSDQCAATLRAEMDGRFIEQRFTGDCVPV